MTARVAVAVSPARGSPLAVVSQLVIICAFDKVPDASGSIKTSSSNTTFSDIETKHIQNSDNKQHSKAVPY